MDVNRQKDTTRLRKMLYAARSVSINREAVIIDAQQEIIKPSENNVEDTFPLNDIFQT